MSLYRSNPGIPLNIKAYAPFEGLQTLRPDSNADLGQNQPWVQLNNAYVDSVGQVTLDRGGELRVATDPVQHVNFYSPTGVAAAVLTGTGDIKIVADNGKESESFFTRFAPISSVAFNRKLIFLQKALPPWEFDGSAYTPALSPMMRALGPAFGAVVQRRLCVAGCPGYPTRVFLSRVDDDTKFRNEEESSDTSVLRAGYIDVANLLSSVDEITGLASFEQNKLAIFTKDRCFVFRIDPDITQWALDDRTSINIGCIAHNTIRPAGDDVLFCSRNGVHSMRRSRDNGLMVESVTLSEPIRNLYRAYVRQVGDASFMSSVFDRDEGQFHIFFPQINSNYAKRICVTIPPDERATKFSTGDFLQARCGAFLGGTLVFGSPAGIYDIVPVSLAAKIEPTATAVTPVLWLGDLTSNKKTHSLLIQASGKGSILVEAEDDQGKKLQTFKVELDGTLDDNNYEDVPVLSQFERPFEHVSRGLRFKFTLTGSGLVRLSGFAVRTRKE